MVALCVVVCPRRILLLAQKAIEHFESYISQRSSLSQNDVASFFSPSWCTPWENSLFWIAGCRPSAFIRLVYALDGADIESKLSEILRGKTMRAVDELQRQTIREEERLTARLAGLQEDMADQPISAIAKGIDWIGEMSGEIEKVLNEHERSMVEVLEEDDKLRLNTLKEILGILHPVQGVDFWP
ncbi:protein DELAY OF GERMINATION 1 [Morus notabilis]|uniref:protein DELAY OF GERMINATION 1 n=1 Tax=Morus notabilis TaxID=981085 RepID=UPI000CED7BCB|nr:protein DELAY OF GERMINATION 1 [Morus notabilis]